MNKSLAIKRTAFILVLLFLGGFSLSSTNSGKAFLRSHFPEIFLNDEKIRILPLGDSLTAGSTTIGQRATESEGGYRWPLWQELTKEGYSIHFLGSKFDGPPDFPEPFHEGHVGIRSDGLLALLPQILSQWHPDVVLLLIGTNDVTQGRPLEQTIANVKRILELIRVQLPHCQILFSGPLPTRQKNLEEPILRLNQSFEKIIAEKQIQDKNIHWVDLYHEAALNPSSDDFSDDVHPTEKGYAKIAEVWNQHLRDKIH